MFLSIIVMRFRAAHAPLRRWRLSYALLASAHQLRAPVVFVNVPQRHPLISTRLTRLIMGIEAEERFKKRITMLDEHMASTGVSLEEVDHAAESIGRAHVVTPVTNAHIVSRLLLAKTKN